MKMFWVNNDRITTVPLTIFGWLLDERNPTVRKEFILQTFWLRIEESVEKIHMKSLSTPPKINIEPEKGWFRWFSWIPGMPYGLQFLQFIEALKFGGLTFQTVFYYIFARSSRKGPYHKWFVRVFLPGWPNQEHAICCYEALAKSFLWLYWLHLGMRIGHPKVHNK